MYMYDIWSIPKCEHTGCHIFTTIISISWEPVSLVTAAQARNGKIIILQVDKYYITYIHSLFCDLFRRQLKIFGHQIEIF